MVHDGWYKLGFVLLSFAYKYHICLLSTTYIGYLENEMDIFLGMMALNLSAPCSFLFFLLPCHIRVGGTHVSVKNLVCYVVENMSNLK